MPSTGNRSDPSGHLFGSTDLEPRLIPGPCQTGCRNGALDLRGPLDACVAVEFMNVALADGALEKWLRLEHNRWRHVWEFEDFRQEVITHLLKCADQFHGTMPCQFRSWVFSLARSAGIDQYRRTKRAARYLRSLPGTDESLEPIKENIDGTEALARGLLASLTGEQHKVMELRYFRNLKPQAIADIMGKSRDAVDHLCSRAIAKLRNVAQNKP
jgi:RNA polymerase sigma factor (sigma-70 family)